MRAVEISVPAFVLGRFHQGVVVREASEKVFNGIDQRNAGIRIIPIPVDGIGVGSASNGIRAVVLKLSELADPVDEKDPV